MLCSFFLINVIVGAPGAFLGNYLISGDLKIAGYFMGRWIVAMLSYIPETKEKS